MMEYRTLNACPACSRQYDVSFLQPGELVRCECGARFAVEFRAPRSPRALCCTSCGANLVDGAKACSYCGAELSLADRGLAGICPKCWSRLPARAKFCLDCGLAIEPQALTALPASSACPRCKSALRSRAVESCSIVECSVCAGLWLTPGMLDGLCERADEAGFASRTLSSGPPTAAIDAQRVAYLPCAMCKELMLRKNFAGVSGVIVDSCKHHGVWLDYGELEKILAFVRAGGLEKARRLEVDRLKAEAERARDQAESAQRMTRFDVGLRDPKDSVLVEALSWLSASIVDRLT
jgi:Zn-finger nucleic acid-binding protein